VKKNLNQEMKQKTLSIVQNSPMTIFKSKFQPKRGASNNLLRIDTLENIITPPLEASKSSFHEVGTREQTDASSLERVASSMVAGQSRNTDMKQNSTYVPIFATPLRFKLAKGQYH
jgi:hypothetical protein